MKFSSIAEQYVVLFPAGFVANAIEIFKGVKNH